VLGYITSAIYS